MGARTERLSLWTVILLLLTMLIAVIHAVAESQLARLTPAARLFPTGWFDA